MGITKKEKILILAKTYPSPSSKYYETSCVAGINEEGVMRRLYPIPFRHINENQKFKKWQWIEVNIEKSKNDHRQESHKVSIDTLLCGEKIETKQNWLARKEWLKKIPTFDSMTLLDEARINQGITLAILRPHKLNGLDIKKLRYPEWTEEEKNKLIASQIQEDIFTEKQTREDLKILNKIPFGFHYRYECEENNIKIEYSHKIVDWEACQFFRNCQTKYGNDWRKPFRKKLEKEFANKDLLFLMGNQHRFPHQWLIISLIYPKRKLQEMEQVSLF